MDPDRLLQRAEIAIGTFCLAAMFAIICINVVLRYALNQPIFWAEEASNYLFVWIGFLSCAAATGEGAHIRVTLFVNLLGARLRRAVALLMDLVTLAMFASFAGPAWTALDSLHVSIALQIPERYPYAIVPAAMALCAVHVALRLARDLRRLASSSQEQSR